MNFRHRQFEEDPQINLIPLIDVLLVILIFLAATTTFTRYAQLDVTLPQAHSNSPERATMQITVSRDGLYALDDRLLSANTAQSIAQAIRAAHTQPNDIRLTINADGQASHESVIRVMDAARLAGVERITFATQGPS